MSDDVKGAVNGNGFPKESIAVSAAIISRITPKLMGRNKLNYSANDSLYTPPEIFEALNCEFDMDVCAPKDGLPWIPAKQFIHAELDGLIQEWNGIVWMNPPYSNTTPWVDKWLAHNNGLALVPFSKAPWFERLWDSDACGQMLHQSMRFINTESKRVGIFMPVGIWAIGDKAIEILKSSPIGKVR